AEEFEKDGGEEGVAEFEGVAARAAQPVRLLQVRGYPLLLRKVGQRNLHVVRKVLRDSADCRAAIIFKNLVVTRWTQQMIDNVARPSSSCVNCEAKDVFVNSGR